ncbi:GGDEF domain-containing protein [Erythrobacter sp.]|jgi:diguanylate cyclase (GGDEF)-like protein|uniref:GGDEF domain-containing protein n=1 Tax=Erythrobacter sp. TaxID=1042 RepID=UPI002EA86462|nr:GGDEF domain-containing protein [Erythrobacter sp.]
MQEQILVSIIPVMTVLLGAGFVGLWWKDRSQLHVLAFSLWFASVSLWTAIQSWFLSELGPAEMLAFTVLSGFSLIALAWGVARRDGKSIPLVAMVAVTTGTGLIAWHATVIGNSAVLLMAQNFNAALLCALAAYSKWESGNRTLADRCLLAILTLLAAYGMFRPSVTVLMRSQMSLAEYTASPLFSFNQVVTALLTLVTAASLLACVLTDRLAKEREAAKIDSLSGLPQRGAFEPLAQDMLARGAAERRAVSLIVANLDHFKAINDTLGHAMGDRVIAGFAQHIAEKIRFSDIAGRIGGEEFCIAVWNCKAAPAARLAERIRTTIGDLGRSTTLDRRRNDEEMDDLDGMSRISASFGVAEARPGEIYAALFKRADEALYRSKNEGRNRVTIASTRRDEAHGGSGSIVSDRGDDAGGNERDRERRGVGEIVPFSRTASL